jgi:hypothetical protein
MFVLALVLALFAIDRQSQANALAKVAEAQAQIAGHNAEEAIRAKEKAEKKDATTLKGVII